jgi:hypothetical protein
MGHLPLRSARLDRHFRLPLQGDQIQRKSGLLHCHLSLCHPYCPPGQGTVAGRSCRRGLVRKN